MNKENLKIVRRENNVGSQLGKGKTALRVDTQGRFIFSKNGAELVGLKKDDGLMFGFNFKDSRAYMFKEDEEDSFRIRERKDGSKHFTSKSLAVHFSDCFDLDTDKKHHFIIKEIGEGYSLELVNKNCLI